ncbi:MAG: DNA replication protein [Alphaproteobacteria bacterium]|nr:DNA replication protein [Alphaproteobacteria bacterium]
MSGSQFVLDLGHRPALGAEDFLVAPCNAAAVAWIDRWPAWPTPTLVIHGPRGAGKSHLANVWRDRSGARPFVAGQAPDRAATAPVMLEDADRRVDEAALFHLYNLVAAHRTTLLITAQQPPARWSIALPDLRSRLVAAPAVAIEPPDDALLGAVLAKQFRDRQLAIADGVIQYAVARMERSFDAARALVDALDRAALAERRAVTVPLARKVLDAPGG